MPKEEPTGAWATGGAPPPGLCCGWLAQQKAVARWRAGGPLSRPAPSPAAETPPPSAPQGSSSGPGAPAPASGAPGGGAEGQPAHRLLPEGCGWAWSAAGRSSAAPRQPATGLPGNGGEEDRVGGGGRCRGAHQSPPQSGSCRVGRLESRRPLGLHGWNPSACPSRPTTGFEGASRRQHRTAFL